MQVLSALIAAIAIATVGGGSAWAQSAAAGRGGGGSGRVGPIGRIGIGVIGPPGLPADLRIRLEDAVAAGLKASGAEVLSAVEVSRARASASLGSCSDSVCEQRLAQLTDTRYWLRGTCQLDTSTYRLHLELVDARAAAVVVARDDTCDICTEADAAEMANVAASALKAALGQANAKRADPAAPTLSATSPPSYAVTDGAAGTNRAAGAAAGPRDSGPAVSGSLGSEANAGGDSRPTWRRIVPWVAYAAAVAAGAGGVYYLAINNTGSHCAGTPDNCRYYNETIWRWGVPLLAVSAAFATTGVVLSTTGREHPTAAAQIETVRTPPPSLLATVNIAIAVGGVTVGGTF